MGAVINQAVPEAHLFPPRRGFAQTNNCSHLTAGGALFWNCHWGRRCRNAKPLLRPCCEWQLLPYVFPPFSCSSRLVKLSEAFSKKKKKNLAPKLETVLNQTFPSLQLILFFIFCVWCNVSSTFSWLCTRMPEARKPAFLPSLQWMLRCLPSVFPGLLTQLRKLMRINEGILQLIFHLDVLIAFCALEGYLHGNENSSELQWMQMLAMFACCKWEAASESFLKWKQKSKRWGGAAITSISRVLWPGDWIRV